MTEKKMPNLENVTEIKRVVNGYFGDPKVMKKFSLEQETTDMFLFREVEL